MYGDWRTVESKWQDSWEKSGIFKVSEDPGKEKYYVLEMFPYPSGEGLHMGHTFNYTIGDVYSRFKRMNGFNVLYPMGYDSFGLPAENAAIKAGVHPKKYTDQAISNFIGQQRSLGLSYDWDRVLSTCSPEYYRWNQYFFLKFMERGLVYRKTATVNWCPECNTVLANEQVHEGRCWRHKDMEVELKDLVQWFIKTTAYAEELLSFIETLKWPERIKIMQRNWIGKSHGVTLKFDVFDEEGQRIDAIETYTTRVDTVYGITYLVLAAEHPKVLEYVKGTSREKEVLDFVNRVRKQSIIDRTAEGKEKNGVFIGKYFINPFTDEKCPIWVADYALYDYGTGAVMAVPTHDQRDFEFAKKYSLPMRVVISPAGHKLNPDKMIRAFTSDGEMVNSGEFNSFSNREAMDLIADLAEDKGWGVRSVNYKLKDWLISRQRYWGTPIPVIHCKECGVVPVPENHLPVLLPESVKFGVGNPLENSLDFVKTSCPVCGKEARRETDTMDTFFDSSWYFLRYCDSNNEREPFDKKTINYWMSVDQYIGGAEHACMHLIYARFFTKALRDMGYLKFDEPFERLFNQGMIHGVDGHVMSKSRGNIVNPTVTIEKYSADALRFFLVSMASPNKDFSWSDTGIESAFKFITNIFGRISKLKVGLSGKKIESKLHKCIRDVTADIENLRYNYALQKLRNLFNSFGDEESRETVECFIKMLHPFCPHMTEELWEIIGNRPFISTVEWPSYDETLIDEKMDREEDLQKQTLQDIRNIVNLVDRKPKKITIFVSPSWKYVIHDVALDNKEYPKNLISRVMKDPAVRKFGKEGANFTHQLAKNIAKLRPVLGKSDEIKALKEFIETFEEEFGCSVEIVEAERSRVDKAGQAAPGKPAIYVE
jgi:leucyl-tRNA synthetase